MSNILIAGGAGFIGSHLCKKLISEGNNIVCIDNLITGDKKNIFQLIENPKFTFLQQDICAPIKINQHIDAVYHLASPASPNAKSARSYINYPIETLLANSRGTHNLLEFSRESSAKFLFASTSEVYGSPAVTPQPESYWGNVNPNGIRSVYDEAKRFGEAITFAFLRKYNQDVRIVRIFNTYGPFMQKDDGRVISSFINEALSNTSITIFGDGDQTRSFCYVDDMVDGLVSALFTDKTKGVVINLGNSDERKISEIATIIKEMVGSKSQVVFEPLPPDDPKMRKPDITKAKNLLQWQPSISLEEGLTKTIAYFRASS